MKQTKRLFLSFLTLLLATMTYAQEVTGTVSDSFWASDWSYSHGERNHQWHGD